MMMMYDGIMSGDGLVFVLVYLGDAGVFFLPFEQHGQVVGTDCRSVGQGGVFGRRTGKARVTDELTQDLHKTFITSSK